MKDDIDKLVKDLPKRAKPLTYYYELDQTSTRSRRRRSSARCSPLVGLENIADAAATRGQRGYPQLSAEVIVKANPDLIFLADTKCCEQSADTVRSARGLGRPHRGARPAVVALDDDIASRWGPRVVDLLRAIIDAVAKAPVG